MMNSWFFYFLKRSISQRKSRFIISTAAVMLTVTIVTSLVTLSLGMREKIGKVLRQYGANMIVTGGSGDYFDESTAMAVKNISEYVYEASFQLYGTSFIEGSAFEIIGMDIGKLKGFRLDGALPEQGSEIIVGTNIKDVLNVKKGDLLRFDDNKALRFKVTGIFEKGSDEDSSIIMSLKDVRSLLGVEGVSAVLLNADTDYIADITGRIKAEHPLLKVKTLKQVAVAEQKILGKVQLLMLIVTAVVMLSSIIALGSTMGANVIERMEEIGLMKAMGATAVDIRNFFMSEAALAGLAGALTGYVAGIVVAEAVSKTAFGSLVPVNIFIVFVALLLGVLIAVVSTYLPVRDAMKVVPANILRGE